MGVQGPESAVEVQGSEVEADPVQQVAAPVEAEYYGAVSR